MSTGDLILDELLRQHAELTEAIQRVREIQQKLERFGDRFDPSLSTTQVFRGVAEELKQALDGEQS